MVTIKLKIDGITRIVDSIKYDYFRPVIKSEERYLKALQKNFPYEIGDDSFINLFPYPSYSLPALEMDPLSSKLSRMARWGKPRITMRTSGKATPR